MKIAFFDIFCGISGDMILGALLDAGLSKNDLERELKKLNLKCFNIKVKKVTRKEISGSKFNIDIEEQKSHRSLKDILNIIDKSMLDEDIKELSKKAFNDLALVEAAIHGTKVDEIHFHEVGAIDSIVDIVGTFIAIKLLGIEKIYSSKVHCGTGFINCRHGMLPVPAPATLALLKGLPVYSKGIESELVTPTGACLIKNLAQSFGDLPPMKIQKIGYGAGSKKLSIPNFLRICIGDSNDMYDSDHSILIETNIDDMTPENLGYVQEKLFLQGAKDVFMTPIYMKKNRPATMMSILTDRSMLNKMLSVVFEETTSLGIRVQHQERKKLEREVISIKTEFGHVDIKVGKQNGRILTISPEYESCKKIADNKSIPFKKVYHKVKDLAESLLLTI